MAQTPLSIIGHPANRSVSLGAAVTFSVAATGTPLGTNAASGLTLEFGEPDALNSPRRFYRARLSNR